MFAQIPNAGFEIWSAVQQENILQWQSYGNVSTYSPSYTGNHSVKLQFDYTYSGTALLLMGNYIDGIGFVGGIPFAERPDSVKGYFKCYSPDPTDFAVLLVIFKKNGVEISNNMYFIPVNSDTSMFVERKFNIPYSHPTLVPDSVIMLLTNPRPFQDTVFSGYLIADDLSFTNVSTPIPNGNFEQWNISSYEEPDQWANFNSTGVFFGEYPAKKTTDCVQGSYALNLQTFIIGSDTISGLVKSSATNNWNSGAFPLNQRFTSLSGNYKFLPENHDSMSIVMLVYHNDTIAGYSFAFFGDTVPQYTHFDIPIYYSENFFGIPDSATLYISTYNLFEGKPLGNSSAYIDNLKLEYNYDIVINEIQSSNTSSIIDEHGEASDWIELYNAGNSIAYLKNFFLSDDLNNPQKWKFDHVLIEPDSFLIVFASGKNHQFLYPHTNFKLNKQGEELILTSPHGINLNNVQFPELPTDFSYGRFPDNTTQLVYFEHSTPGASNTSIPVSSFTYSKPLFSIPGGFFTDSIYLTITAPNGNASIRFTLDGSIPDETSALYTGPILIKSKTGTANGISMIDNTSPWWIPPAGKVFKSTVVRAKLFIPDTLTLATETATFFVDNGIFSRYNVPVISIVTDSINLFGYERGIYVKGKIYDDWIAAHPDSLPLFIPGNYLMRGDAWERQAHIEFFEKDGTPGFSCDAGIRTHGGASRMFRHKSLRISFRDKYETDQIDYPVFPDLKTRAGQFPLTKFNGFILRNSGNDYDNTMFRDGLIQRLIHHTLIDFQDIRPAVVFLNGEFWGFHNIREKQDENYISHHYHFPADDAHILETYGNVADGPYDAPNHFIEMYQYIENNNMSQTNAYQYVISQMDITDFIHYQCIQIYIRNTDWPGNNVKFWRKGTSQFEPLSPYGQDGRWRWIIFDTDFGFGLVDEWNAAQHNTLAFATDPNQTEWPNPAWSTLLLRKLLDNNHFKNDFINIMADHMNSSFKPHRVIEVIDSMQIIYSQNMQEHLNRWHSYGTIGDWETKVNIMRVFAQQRPTYMQQHIIDKWGLTGTSEITLNVSDVSHGNVHISSLVINEQTIAANTPVYPWTGTYFNDIPIPVKAVPKPGYAFVEWEGTGITNPEIIIQMTEDTLLKAIFVFDSSYHQNLLYLNEIMATNTLTVYDEFGEYDDWIEIYNPGTDTIDIAGMYLTDNLFEPHKHKITGGSSLTKIPPKGFLLLWADGQPEQGVLHLSFKLSADGEAAGLFHAYSYEPVDTISFGPQSNDISYGRYPDGNAQLVYFTHPTPGSSNILPVDEPDTETEFFVYPVPANDYLYLSHPRDIRIFSITGVLVYKADNISFVDILNLNNGLYFIQTSDNEIVKFIKF